MERSCNNVAIPTTRLCAKHGKPRTQETGLMKGVANIHWNQPVRNSKIIGSKMSHMHIMYMYIIWHHCQAVLWWQLATHQLSSVRRRRLLPPLYNHSCIGRTGSKFKEGPTSFWREKRTSSTLSPKDRFKKNTKYEKSRKMAPRCIKYLKQLWWMVCAIFRLFTAF